MDSLDISADQHAAPAASPEPRKPLAITISALMLVLLLAALDQTIVSTALPAVVSQLGGVEHLSWVVTAYMITSTVVTPIYGKLGDLFGRKLMLQSAIVIFLIGSVFCGASHSMLELIIWRAVQGVGAGGLMITVMAAMGDLVPLRERGKYQGWFGAVFGLSTIIGPLLGGLFVDHLGWQWIFFINIPLGLAAFAVIASVFKSQPKQISRPMIDYWGAVLLTGALSFLVLFASLGGNTFPWLSWPIALFALGAAAMSYGFVQVERRAEEPIVPLSLFAIPAVRVATSIGFILGVAMFGCITFLPLYLQVVKGLSASDSGMVMVPMMVGMLSASIYSGRSISRTGRYRKFPIIGTALAALGLGVLSLLSESSPVSIIVAGVVCLGLGIGSVMQVTVLATQNAAPARQLGVATSAATLVRSVGSSLGVAAFGAIMAAQLHDRLPGSFGQFGEGGGLDIGRIRLLPAAERLVFEIAFAQSLQIIFIAGALIMIGAFALALKLEEAPLRQQTGSDSSV